MISFGISKKSEGKRPERTLPKLHPPPSSFPDSHDFGFPLNKYSKERERERILLLSDKSKVQSFFFLYVCQLQEDNLLRQLLHGRGTTQFFNGSDFMHFWLTIFLFAVVSSPSNWVPSSIFFFFSFFINVPSFPRQFLVLQGLFIVTSNTNQFLTIFFYN